MTRAFWWIIFETTLSVVILAAAIAAVFIFVSNSKTSAAIITIALLPFAAIQGWVAVLLARAYLRHPENLRLSDYMRNYAFKVAAYAMFAVVGANGIFSFLPRPESSILLVLGVYVLAVPGIVELIRYYGSSSRF